MLPFASADRELLEPHTELVFTREGHDLLRPWNGVTPVLADRFSMLIPDLLGYGNSEKPADAEITVGDQADLV